MSKKLNLYNIQVDYKVEVTKTTFVQVLATDKNHAAIRVSDCLKDLSELEIERHEVIKNSYVTGSYNCTNIQKITSTKKDLQKSITPTQATIIVRLFNVPDCTIIKNKYNDKFWTYSKRTKRGFDILERRTITAMIQKEFLIPEFIGSLEEWETQLALGTLQKEQEVLRLNLNNVKVQRLMKHLQEYGEHKALKLDPVRIKYLSKK